MSASVKLLDFRRESGMSVAIRGGFARRRVVVHGSAESGTELHLPFCRWLMPPGEDYRRYSVFSFALPPDRLARWRKTSARPRGYIVARNEAVARRVAEAHFNRIAAKYSGLARNALTACMRRLSTRGGQLVGGAPARRIAERASVSSVVKGEVGGGYRVLVADNLEYAVDALRGGKGAIDTALARAANSVNGRINRYISTHPAFFDSAAYYEPMSAPFPDVVRR